jgi:hypothetical protein
MRWGGITPDEMSLNSSADKTLRRKTCGLKGWSVLRKGEVRTNGEESPT